MIGVVALFIAVWSGFLWLQPACGAQTNSMQAQIETYAPWALVVVETLVLSRVWERRGRDVARPTSIVWAVGFSVAVGFVVFAFWPGSGSCGE